MTWPEGVALELILLGIGWSGFKFLTRNVRSFLELRQETRRQMQRFAMDAPRRPGHPAMSPEPEISPGRDSSADPDVQPGTEVFRQLGFQMLIFAHTARMAAWVVKIMGYDPIKAGDNLISLAQDTGLAFRRKSIADALRFNDGPSDDH
jgi:hypothetical protein